MRPQSITIICIILFVTDGFNLLGWGRSFPNVSLGRAVWSLAITLVSLASLVGLWRMRRWAPVLYLAGFVVSTVAILIVPAAGASAVTAMPVFWITLLAVPAIYCVVVLPHWSKLK